MFCKSCQTEKDVSEFYNNDKHHCKACIRKRVHENRMKKIDYYREFDRNRYNKEERAQKVKEYKARLRIENPEKYDKIFHGTRKRYRKNHSEKCKAHNIVDYAISTGKLIRPTKCERCNKDCKPQAHHYDYSKPLDVIWLCTSCHSEVHKEMRRNGREVRSKYEILGE